MLSYNSHHSHLLEDEAKLAYDRDEFAIKLSKHDHQGIDAAIRGQTQDAG
jgi:hypothetical protein